MKVVDKMVVPKGSFSGTSNFLSPTLPFTLPFPVKFELRQFEISRRDLARAARSDCAGVESIFKPKCHNKKVVNTSGVTIKISHEFYGV